MFGEFLCDKFIIKTLNFYGILAKNKKIFYNKYN